MTATLLALLLSPALACDHASCDHVDDDTIVVWVADAEADADAPTEDVEEDHRRPHDPGYIAVRGDWIGLGNRSTWGVALRGRGKRDGWIGAEGRWAEDGAWMGRFGAGVDLFGRSAFDLGLGLVAGHIGDWQTAENQRFAVGTEVVVGFNPGRLILEHRHLGGQRPGGGLRTEGHTRLGWRFGKSLEVAVDFANIDPGGPTSEVGAGLSLGLRL